jgi:hypothetical protein
MKNENFTPGLHRNDDGLPIRGSCLGFGNKQYSVVVVGKRSGLVESIELNARLKEHHNYLQPPQLEGWFHITHRPDPNKALLVEGTRRHVQRLNRLGSPKSSSRKVQLLLATVSTSRIAATIGEASPPECLPTLRPRVTLVRRAHPRGLSSAPRHWQVPTELVGLFPTLEECPGR